MVAPTWYCGQAKARADVEAFDPRAPRRREPMLAHWLSWLQWPAMFVTEAAACFVASPPRPRRNMGLRLLLLSNVLWVAWAAHSAAYALVVLQFRDEHARRQQERC